MVAYLHIHHLAVATPQKEEDCNYKYLNEIDQIQIIGPVSITNYSRKPNCQIQGIKDLGRAKDIHIDDLPLIKVPLPLLLRHDLPQPPPVLPLLAEVGVK